MGERGVIVSLLERADALFEGRARIEDHHPIGGSGELVEVGDGAAFIATFANVSAFSTDEGLVLVDTGSFFVARAVHSSIRAWNHDRVHSAVYSHGHIDHVFGVSVFEEEVPVRVVAHEAVAARFDRYKLTAGYNASINRRQFRVPGLEWPTEYRYPDLTYRDSLTLDVGGERFELRHARGETDDHTWTWIPARKTICCGDLFMWSTPNAGNPQKVQRYPREWAAALREMATLSADVLLPGHGLPVVGATRVRAVLADTAALLESLVEQTLAMMNDGARLDDVVHSVRAPAELLGKPYLQPVYDDPEFIVRTIWRQYGGWWDGNPATLKPARDADLAVEIAALCGGAKVLSARALELSAQGNLRLAAHLAEMAALADPAEHPARADVYRAREAAEPSLMAKAIFGAAAAESAAEPKD